MFRNLKNVNITLRKKPINVTELLSISFCTKLTNSSHVKKYTSFYNTSFSSALYLSSLPSTINLRSQVKVKSVCCFWRVKYLWFLSLQEHYLFLELLLTFINVLIFLHLSRFNNHCVCGGRAKIGNQQVILCNSNKTGTCCLLQSQNTDKIITSWSFQGRLAYLLVYFLSRYITVDIIKHVFCLTTAL